MGGVIFVNIEGTRLYRPEQSGRYGKLLFLLLEGESTEKRIPLEKTWNDQGTSAYVGYYVNVNRLPEKELPSFEASLRKALPPDAPKRSSFAWARVTSAEPAEVTDALPLLIAPDDQGRMMVAQEFRLNVPARFPGLAVSAGSSVVAAHAAGEIIEGFVIGYPPLGPFHGMPAADPPGSIGLALPMNSDAAGCFQFNGLMNAPLDAPPPGAGETIKDLYDVSIDPLDFFNTRRTYRTITGRRFLLKKVNGVFSIQPL